MMCRSVPLMMCDMTENNGEDVMAESSVGKMIMLKAPQGGNGYWGPGNFGPLVSPYGAGANNVERSLAEVDTNFLNDALRHAGLLEEGRAVASFETQIIGEGAGFLLLCSPATGQGVTPTRRR